MMRLALYLILLGIRKKDVIVLLHVKLNNRMDFHP